MNGNPGRIWLNHERRQHAVGQGGFHSAEVSSIGGGKFWYVYDCGSSNRDALQRELDTFREEHWQRSLDLLALSHLDEDHVNGVESLLSDRDVTSVLIPYLGSEDRLLLIAESCARGSLTPSRWDLAEDPVMWFRDRGAEEVIQVLPSGDVPPDVPGVDAVNFPEEPSFEGPFQLHAVREASEREKADWVELDATSRVIRSGEPLVVTGLQRGRSLALWELVPFCHPEVSRVGPFEVQVRKAFGLGRRGTGRSFMRGLRKVLADKTKRAELKELYGQIRSDRNLSSMSLYSGPCHDWAMTFGRIETRRRSAGNEARSWHRGVAPGWLGTGDAKLTVQSRALRFAAHYEQRFARVGSFVVPHHGSRGNFAGHLFKESLNPAVWCAPSGRNTYGHPDRDLKRALSRRGEFVQVSHRAGDDLLERFVWFS